MLNLFLPKSVMFVIAGGFAIGSAFMYGIGKMSIEPESRLLEHAPLITQQSPSGYGYLEGPLVSESPILCNFDKKQYVRVDEAIYQISQQKLVQLGEQNHMTAQYQKRTDYLHRSTQHCDGVLINNVNIGPFLKAITPKFIGTTFAPSYPIPSVNGSYTNVQVNTSNAATNLLGEHEREVIGLEKIYSGIPHGKKYTIFGYFNANDTKMSKDHNNVNIISKKSRDDIVHEYKNYSRNWNFFWGTATLLCSIGTVVSYFVKRD